LELDEDGQPTQKIIESRRRQTSLRQFPNRAKGRLLKTTLKAKINEEGWSTLHSDTSRPFDKPKLGRIAVKVINHLGNEVMKVFRLG